MKKKRTNKQIESATRNFGKMRLLGLTGTPFNEKDIKLLSEEKVLFRKINLLKTQLLNNWDHNTKSIMKNITNEASKQNS